MNIDMDNHCTYNNGRITNEQVTAKLTAYHTKSTWWHNWHSYRYERVNKDTQTVDIYQIHIQLLSTLHRRYANSTNEMYRTGNAMIYARLNTRITQILYNSTN
eukprot:904682_1